MVKPYYIKSFHRVKKKLMKANKETKKFLFTDVLQNRFS